MPAPRGGVTLARAFPWLAGLGLVARLLALQAPGTYDVEIQKGWAAQAAGVGLRAIYGPSDDELRARAHAEGRGTLEYAWRERLPYATFTWQGSPELFVDYPPGSLLVLFAAGSLYRALDPGLSNTKAFTAVINLAPLLGSLVIAWLLWRSSAEHGRARALAFWLNPAALLAAPLLGYQDTVVGALALGAVIALQQRRVALGAALVTAAGLVKPQGALLLPILLVVLARDAGWRERARALGAGALVAVAILAPWWSGGHLLSALDGCRRPLGQPTLAPLGLNVWWIAGWLTQWTREGPWPLASVQTLAAFERAAGFDARVVARPALLLASAAVVALLLRAPRHERRFLPLALCLQVHAYALLGTSVHENHTLLAVFAAPLVLGAWPGAVRVWAAVSAFAFANLFLMDGFGRKLPRLRELRELRALTGVDASVLVAAAHVVLVALLVLWSVRRLRAARAAGPLSAA